MRKFIARASAAATAVTALGALGVTGVSAAGAGEVAPQPADAAAAGPLAVPGAQLWVQRYNGPGNGFDEARSVAVAPGGGRVFVTGDSVGRRATGETDYATVAYNAATGARLWLKRYNGPGNGADQAHSVAVSPDGTRVFVTGRSWGTTPNGDYATVAYSAATGARLWVARYNGPGKSEDDAVSAVVSPGGGSVFVTGTSKGTGGGIYSEDYATVAYNTATGHRLWVARYNGPANNLDRANAVVVSPGGRRVYVTGSTTTGSGHTDYATIAYNAATGHRLWIKRYDSGPADSGQAAAVSPNGKTVFVAGYSGPSPQYATVAYNAATGARRWVARYAGRPEGASVSSIAVSPGGGRVYVTGTTGWEIGTDYTTVAYNAATGHRVWAKFYNGPASRGDRASSMGVAPDGGTVYVTGTSEGAGGRDYGNYPTDYVTIAYTAATGARRWITRYNGPGNGSGNAQAYSLAVSPTADRIFVTGLSGGTTSLWDYATVAYRG